MSSIKVCCISSSSCSKLERSRVKNENRVKSYENQKEVNHRIGDILLSITKISRTPEPAKVSRKSGRYRREFPQRIPEALWHPLCNVSHCWQTQSGRRAMPLCLKLLEILIFHVRFPRGGCSFATCGNTGFFWDKSSIPKTPASMP